MTHGDCVSKVADNFKAVGHTGSGNGNIVAIANEKEHIYGLQFHPEVRFSANVFGRSLTDPLDSVK